MDENVKHYHETRAAYGHRLANALNLFGEARLQARVAGQMAYYLGDKLESNPFEQDVFKTEWSVGWWHMEETGYGQPRVTGVSD